MAGAESWDHQKGTGESAAGRGGSCRLSPLSRTGTTHAGMAFTVSSALPAQVKAVQEEWKGRYGAPQVARAVTGPEACMHSDDAALAAWNPHRAFLVRIR